ncbi:hypothetical protein CAP38_08585 [Hydrogenophaga sp. IBVHS2]|nr:hypothetical protein CAP38_08585 [Hydrogenophaga sp. IBVHS2]
MARKAGGQRPTAGRPDRPTRRPGPGRPLRRRGASSPALRGTPTRRCPRGAVGAHGPGVCRAGTSGRSGGGPATRRLTGRPVRVRVGRRAQYGS